MYKVISDRCVVTPLGKNLALNERSDSTAKVLTLPSFFAWGPRPCPNQLRAPLWTVDGTKGSTALSEELPDCEKSQNMWQPVRISRGYYVITNQDLRNNVMHWNIFFQTCFVIKFST